MQKSENTEPQANSRREGHKRSAARKLGSVVFEKKNKSVIRNVDNSPEEKKLSKSIVKQIKPSSVMSKEKVVKKKQTVRMMMMKLKGDDRFN